MLLGAEPTKVASAKTSRRGGGGAALAGAAVGAATGAGSSKMPGSTGGKLLVSNAASCASSANIVASELRLNRREAYRLALEVAGEAQTRR